MKPAAAKRRKSIPLLVKLHAALYQLGFEPHEVDLDHDPALALRAWDDAAQDTIPPANDPKYLVWRPRTEHRTKTFGRGGERRISTAGSDIHAIAKVKRLARAVSDFDLRLLAKTTGEALPTNHKRKAKIPSRPFPKRMKV